MISDVEKKNFITLDYNIFTREILDAKIKKRVNKSDLSGFMNNSDLDKKIATLVTKAELLAEWSKIEKCKYDSILFIGQSYFDNDGSQNFLIFQPFYKRNCTVPAGLTDTIVEWELGLLLQQIIVFLPNLCGWIIQD